MQKNALSSILAIKLAKSVRTILEQIHDHNH